MSRSGATRSAHRRAVRRRRAPERGRRGRCGRGAIREGRHQVRPWRENCSSVYNRRLVYRRNPCVGSTPEPTLWLETRSDRMTEPLPSTTALPAESKRSAAKPNSSPKSLPVEPTSVVWNPSPAELRRFTEEMPNCRITEFDNVNVATRVVSRSKLSTFIATDTPEEHSDQTISRAEYQRMAQLQNDYIRTRDMLVVEGYIGNDPEFRVPARLIIEKANANIAGMQQHLYYPATPEKLEHFEPNLTVIYTPNLKAEGYPEDRLIAVDLENYVTRVFHSDYFGESKKGGLRMWNKLVYERGGLALHAGCKVIPVGDANRVGLIVGLS